MRQLRHPSLVEGLTAIMLVALPVLGVLQYRWLGSVSDAERERMRANMQATIEQVRTEFDGRVANAYTSLVMDAEIYRQRDWARYADRVDAWRRSDSDSDLVLEIDLLEYTLDGEVSTWRLDPAHRSFERSELSPAVTSLVRPAAPDALPDRPRDSRSFGFEYSPTASALPAFVIPILPKSSEPYDKMASPRAAFLVAELDIKALARVPFAVADGIYGPLDDQYAFQLEVAPNETAHGDASAVVFRLSPEEISRLSPARAHGETPSFRRLVRQTPEGETIDHFLVATVDPGLRIVATHPSGSLEVAVAAARTRNLAVAFGTLLLLGASAVALVVASRRAQRLARQQVEFVAGVSHELRTPLAVICSAAENLSHGIVTSEPQVRRYGALIEGEGRRLADLVEQVLEYAGASSNRSRYAMQQVAIGPVLEEAVAACGRAAAEAGVDVDVDASSQLPEVVGDPAALRRAVENLVANAVKYSEGPGAVRVSARVAPDGGVVVEVADRGRGIAASDLPHIFEPFYRGRDAVDAQIRGSGLGLSLARRVVSAHGGTISVESRAGAGSTFTVRLPAAPVEDL